MRLIDANELIAVVKELCVDCECHPDDWKECRDCCNVWEELWHIERVPTIDQVKHGKWIDKEREIDAGIIKFTAPYSVCSICGADGGNKLNYCSICGAKMDLED